MNEITRNLWIGDIQDARERATDRFDVVVTVCQDSVADNIGCQYHHFNMSDGETEEYGGECTYDLFEEAAETVEEALERDETVLVHCHMGQSRSASVCIAALAAHRDLSYEEAYTTVARRRYIQPDRKLINHARAFTDDRLP